MVLHLCIVGIVESAHDWALQGREERCLNERSNWVAVCWFGICARNKIVFSAEGKILLQWILSVVLAFLLSSEREPSELDFIGLVKKTFCPWMLLCYSKTKQRNENTNESEVEILLHFTAEMNFAWLARVCCWSLFILSDSEPWLGVVVDAEMAVLVHDGFVASQFSIFAFQVPSLWLSHCCALHACGPLGAEWPLPLLFAFSGREGGSRALCCQLLDFPLSVPFSVVTGQKGGTDAGGLWASLLPGKKRKLGEPGSCCLILSIKGIEKRKPSKTDCFRSAFFSLPLSIGDRARFFLTVLWMLAASLVQESGWWCAAPPWVPCWAENELQSLLCS